MTSAQNQPFCGKYNINIGCFDGPRINPRNMTQRKIALFIHSSHFCLIWKSNGISVFQVIPEELKQNFKIVDIVISDKHVEAFIKYEYNSIKSSISIN